MPTVYSKYPETFVTAVKNRQYNEVEKILQTRTVDINANNVWDVSIFEHSTPLMYTSYYGDTDMARLLLKYNADVNKCDTYGTTALHWAAGYGHTEIVVALIQDGNADINKCNRGGDTALLWAAFNGHTEIVVALIQDGNAHVNKCNTDGTTALHCAAIHGRTETVVALIQDGNADVNKCDSRDSTALTCAAMLGRTETVVALIQKGNADVNKADNQGDTPLHIAARGDYGDTVLQLLQNKADFSIVNNNNETALQCAAPRAKQVITEFNNKNKQNTIASSSLPEGYIPENNKQATSRSAGSSLPEGYIPKKNEQTTIKSAGSSLPEGYMPANVPVLLKDNTSPIFKLEASGSTNTESNIVAVPYKRVDDPNQHIPILHGMITLSNPPSMLPVTTITGRPTERHLNDLSADIGHEWVSLAIELGISHRGTQQIQISHPHSGRRQILEMLLQWRYGVEDEDETERCEILRNALIKTGHNDLAKSL